jgi:benzoyl-CoA reductase subunit C
MEEILKTFFEYSEDPYKCISEWKEKTDQKVIGCYPMHIPEEIIHAAGVLPVVIWRSNEAVTLGHAHVPPYNCGLTRSFVDDAVKGKLTFFDGVVIYRMCLQSSGLPFILEKNVGFPYMEYLYLPAIFPGKATENFLIEELERLKTSIEAFTGKKITTESLNQSIEVYNKNRRLLHQVYALRKSNGNPIKAKEMQTIVHAGMLMPKEQHNDLLEKLLPELHKRSSPTDKKTKLVMMGGLCQTIQPTILDLMEELGISIVDDDMYVGSRYFVNEVELNDNPIKSLANRYLKRAPPCSTKGDWEMDWTDYVIDMVKSNQAQGILSVMIKFCPPHLCYYPETLVEVEHEVISLEQTRTRLQSFLEIIGGGA